MTPRLPQTSASSQGQAASVESGPEGEWAIQVTGNMRITFRFEGEDVVDVNLEDYH